MRTPIASLAALALCSSLVAAQETKPVPKDSMRLSIPGCTHGYVFTAGPRNSDQPGSFEIPEGMHLRMNGDKKLMADIKAHEGSMVEITGLMKKSQYNEGINIGGGVRVSAGPAPGQGLGSPSAGQIQIDVEGWRPVEGACKAR
ncbi:MAG TPA: hypothetical protein VF219_02665 [Vicinamibacterales bacterium]